MNVVKPFVVRHGGGKAAGPVLPGSAAGGATGSAAAEGAGADAGPRNAVYSLDFQPGSLRIATAGGDTTVKIWDGSLLLSGTPDVIRNDALLATLEFHEKSVNSVRWSRCGSMLASGSDDGYVLVYRQAPAEEMRMHLFGSESAKSKENWARLWTLHGHHMDVLGVAWSPDGVLASCSVDNSVMIWDVPPAAAPHSTGVRGGVLTPRVTLRGHSSFVKGVAFDPVGRLLASCGADNLVILWSMETWTEVARINEPLKDSVDNTIFRRLDWAPDGGSFCLSAAVKACKPLAAVIQRSTWNCVADLVGHDVATTCSRFHSKLVVGDNLSGRVVPSCVVAVGDQRGVVSIWTTSKNVPLFVIRDMFSDAIVDMSWSPLPGSTGSGGASAVLGMCSLDGTIALVAIDGSGDPAVSKGGASALGNELSGPALNEHFVRMYGKKLEDLLSSNSRGALPVAAAKSKIKVPAANKNTLAPAAVMYSSAAAKTTSVLPQPAVVNPSFSTVGSASTSAANSITGTATTMSSGAMSRIPSQASAAGPSSVRQLESRRAVDGKKRITPVTLVGTLESNSSASGDVSGIPKRPRVALEDSAASVAIESVLLDSTSSFGHRTVNVPATVSTDDSIRIRDDSSRFDRHFAPASYPASAPVSNTHVPVPPPAAAPAPDASRNRVADRTGPELNLKAGEIFYTFKTDQLVSRSWIQTLGAEASGSIWHDILDGSFRLFVGVVKRPPLLSRMSGTSAGPANVSVVSLLKLRPGCQGGTIAGAAVHAEKDTVFEPLWTTFLTSRCSAVGALSYSNPETEGDGPTNTSIIAPAGVAVLGFMDGSIQFLSLEQGGLRISPALALGAPVVSVRCLGSQEAKRCYCLAVCADGECYVWALQPRELVSASSVEPAAAIKLAFKTSIRPTVSALRSMYTERASADGASIESSSLYNDYIVDDVYLAFDVGLQQKGQEQRAVETSSVCIRLFASISCLASPGAGDAGSPPSMLVPEERALFEYLPGPGAWSQLKQQAESPPSFHHNRLQRWKPSDPRVDETLLGQAKRSALPSTARLGLPPPSYRPGGGDGAVEVASVARVAGALLHRVQRDFGAEASEAAVAIGAQAVSGGGLEPPAPAEWACMLDMCSTEEQLMRLLPTAVATAAAAVAAGGSAASAADFGQAVGEAQLGACLEHWVGLACQLGNVAGIKCIVDRLLAMATVSVATGATGRGTGFAVAAHSAEAPLSLSLLERHVLPALGQASSSAAAQDLLVGAADAVAVAKRLLATQ